MQVFVSGHGTPIEAEKGALDSPFRMSGVEKASIKILEDTQIAFTIGYRDVAFDTGAGFDHPNQGPARRDVVERVLRYIDGVLDESGAVDVLFDVSSNNVRNPFLANAGTLIFKNAGLTNGFAFQRITTNVDPNPDGEAELIAQVNFGANWYTGTGAPSALQYDLYSVLLHEITHGLGMITFMNGQGGSVVPNVYSVWDGYLESLNGDLVSLLDVPTFMGAPSELESGVLFFTGPASTRMRGAHPTVFAPSPFRPGSSLSHMAHTNGANLVMSPSIAKGESIRQYRPFEMAALEDLGYRLTTTQFCPVGAATLKKESLLTELGDIEWSPSSPKTIFGIDTRMEAYELDPASPLISLARATVALVHSQDLIEQSDGTFSLSTYQPTTDVGTPLCASEPFFDQPAAAFCSGFLVAPDVVVTAGGCLATSDLEGVAIVFGFEMEGLGIARTQFEPNTVYKVVEVIAREFDSGQIDANPADYAVLRLDRPVPGATAVPLALSTQGFLAPGTTLGTIGHPSGLPLKVAFDLPGAPFAESTRVTANCNDTFFVSNLDADFANAGSPVFNAATFEVEGIVVRGTRDYVTIESDFCAVANRQVNSAGDTECTKSTLFASLIPGPPTSAGTVSLNKERYVCGETLVVEVQDSDLAGAASVSVEILSTSGLPVTATLEPVVADSMRFRGFVDTSTVAVTANGVSMVTDGAMVEAIYIDVDDGTGASAERAAMAEIVCRALLEVTPASLDFGLVAVGATKTEALTVRNIGVSISEGGVSIDTPFAVLGDALYTAGDTFDTVTVSFSPTQAGSFANTLVLSGTDGSMTTVAVQGTGVKLIVASQSGCAAAWGSASGATPFTRNLADLGMLFTVGLVLSSLGRRKRRRG